MASSSRETPIHHQHISGITASDGAQIFAGTSTNTTTNHIYNGPVNQQHDTTETKQPEEQITSYYEIPNRRVAGFVGRESILQRIDEALSDESSPHYAVLQGMGGQGKSQVALEYCRRKKDRPYSAIFWVDATSQDRVEGSFQAISERIKRQTDHFPDIDARVAFVLRMFISWTVQWLLVFDNYDNPDSFPNIQDFIPRSELGAILVTSRHPDSNALVFNQSTHFIELFGLEEDAAVALLIQQSQTIKDISEDAKEIVNRLVCHPLAVTQAGAYIRKRKLRLCEFMDHYQRRKRTILENTPQLSQYRKRLGNAEEETSMNVFTTWELSFQQLRSQATENNVEAKLLTLLAYFDEKDISEQLFAGFGTVKEQEQEGAKLLMWLDAFSNDEGQWDSDLFEDVLIRLRDSSLLQAYAQELDGFYHASLHSLVKDWIRLRTDRSIGQDNTYMASTLVTVFLSNSWQEGDHFNLPLFAKQRITSHIVTLEESYQEFFIPQPSILSSQYSNSQIWFARFLRNTGSYNLAERIYQRLNVQYEMTLGLEHPDTLINMSNLALTYSNQGRLKEAEELGVKVMETSSRVLGLEHPDTLTSIANLASTYSTQGQWNEAEELEVQVMETRKRVLGFEHPSTLTIMANLAATYRNQGSLKDAEELDVQVIETSLRVLGLEHPDTLSSTSSLASTFWKQGRWNEAEELFMQVMETRKRLLGLEHPDTLSSMADLAITYSSQGQWNEAEELEMQVIETTKRVLGLEHPDTLIYMSNLAGTYLNQGRWKEAEELGVQVMETSSRVLGIEHPDTLTIMSNFAKTFSDQGRWKEAEELEVQVMETSSRVLGIEHPNTLTSMSNLAKTFRDQGRWKEAEELFVQVMEARKLVLGLQHASTLKSMNNLAITYQEQGRWKESEELEVQIMEMSSRVLGLEHPDTLTSMAELAKTFWNQGQLKEAEELEVQVMETRKRVLGLEHPDTLTSIVSLASSYSSQGRLKEAEELEVQVMETRKRVLGPEHPNTLISMSYLAFTFWGLNQRNEAIALMSEVVEHCLETIGSDHPATISSLNTLNEWQDGE